MTHPSVENGAHVLPHIRATLGTDIPCGTIGALTVGHATVTPAIDGTILVLRDNPDFLRRTAASIKAGLAFFGESKERLRRVVTSLVAIGETPTTQAPPVEADDENEPFVNRFTISREEQLADTK